MPLRKPLIESMFLTLTVLAVAAVLETTGAPRAVSSLLLVFVLAGPFLITLVMRWVVAPIRIRSRQRMAVRPTYELTRAEQLTPEMQQFIGTAVRQFDVDGFKVAANVHQPDGVTDARGVPTVRAVQVLLVNRATNDTAVIIATLGTLSIFRGLALISVPTKSLPSGDKSLPDAFTTQFMSWQFTVQRGDAPPILLQPVPMLIIS